MDMSEVSFSKGATKKVKKTKQSVILVEFNNPLAIIKPISICIIEC